ncbi:MAG: hypothetical protein P2975_02855 [Gemmatimonadota bacterium]|jgi:hypothetical protein|nr:hypothetical protein [Gemmatimonadota bacterium]MDQ8150270.1 hypothetical protein [Gemmatimonadota bacterium]MDQ8151975.1 hypothetical protein [Gemmatimonadota bacterium]MDQ8178003.1 hypothetical protein [Gemmatimonadota bacterium]
MKRIVLVASIFALAACGGAKTEEAAPAADSTAVAPAPAVTDSAAPATTDSAAAAAPAAAPAK